MFKKGDKVIAIVDIDNKISKGTIGICYDNCYNNGSLIPVKWESFIGTEKGWGAKNKVWGTNSVDIKLYQPTIKTLNKDTVKVGQKVRVINDKIGNNTFLKNGYEGKIEKLSKSLNYPNSLWVFLEGQTNAIISESVELLEEPKPKDVIPEYVECLETVSGQYTKGKIYKNNISKSTLKHYHQDADDAGYSNGWSSDKFKPSTKEAFDLQNQPKVEVLVFGKFKIGSIVVSLTTIHPRETGQILKVIEKSTSKKLYYTDTAYSINEGEFRAATDVEVKAFEQGITNINDMKAEEEYSFYVKYEPDFTEDIFNRLINWCKDNLSLKRTWRDFTDNSFNSFKENTYFFIDCSSSGDLQQSVGVDNNRQGAKKQLSLSELCTLIGYKQEVKEQSINTYGLKVGDNISFNIINAWADIKGNYSYSTDSWEKQLTPFTKDVTITSFKIINGIVGARLGKSGNWGYYIKAEGFKEFMENFDKPEFDSNKWYKLLGTTGNYYVKDKFDNDGLDSFKEHIKNDKYYNSSINLGLIGTYKYEKIDISLIQQYLPEGHVDKINTNSMENPLITEAKRRYPIGTKFYPAHLNQKSEYCIVTNTKFELSNDAIHVLTDEGSVFDSNRQSKYGKTNYNRMVYCDGKWADIIQESNSEEFKVGDWVIGWHSNYKEFKTKAWQIVSFLSSMYVCPSDNESTGIKDIRKATLQEIAKAQGYNPLEEYSKTGYILGMDPTPEPSSNASIEEILAYCKLKYKEGDTIIPVKVNGDYYSGESILEGTIQIFDNDAVGTHSTNGFLYTARQGGKYAKIVSSSKKVLENLHKNNPLLPEDCVNFVKPKKKEYLFNEQEYLSKPFNQKLELNLKVKTNKKSKITI